MYSPWDTRRTRPTTSSSESTRPSRPRSLTMEPLEQRALLDGIGVVSGIAAGRRHKVDRGKQADSQVRCAASQSWGWALGLLIIWFFGSWLAGYFFNPIMLKLSGFFFLFFDLGLPVWVAYAGYAKERCDEMERPV